MAAAIPPGMDLSMIPAGLPPNGTIPNFANPESLGTITKAIFGTLIGLTTLAVAARCFFNFKNAGKKLGNDDICAILALVFSIGQSAIILSMTETLRHQWDTPVSFYTSTYFKKVYAQQVFAWPALFLAKTAILLLYRRIFHIKVYMRVCVWIGIAWAFVTYMPTLFVNSYYCTPHAGEEWDFAVGMNCSKPLPWEVAAAALSVMLDLFILVLPIPIILGLHLSPRKKLGVLLVFVTASLAVICAVLTLVYRVQVMQTHNAYDGDAAWKTAQLYICNGAENYTAIIVSCVPGISSFFKIYVKESRIYSSFASSFSASRRGSRFLPKDNSSSASSTPQQKPMAQMPRAPQPAHLPFALRTVGGTPTNADPESMIYECDSNPARHEIDPGYTRHALDPGFVGDDAPAYLPCYEEWKDGKGRKSNCGATSTEISSPSSQGGSLVEEVGIAKSVKIEQRYSEGQL